MIRRDPSLILKRLVVTKGGTIAYDEPYHLGVNMIRSEGNSRGKSTIAELIFFALGGDLTSWKDEAGSCDQTFAEVLLNGATMTLRRDIDSKRSQLPMWIFFGPYESAIQTASEGWLKYGYRRAEDRESFSQVIFRALEMPEVPAEEANITMHQLLRLMYVDQLTPVNAIFRSEEKDAPLRRQAVGDLLCGVLDERIYPSQLEARRLEKAYDQATGQLSGLLRVLRRVDENLDFSDLTSRQSAVEEERERALAAIEVLRAERFSPSEDTLATSAVLETLRADLDGISRAVVEAQRELDRVVLSIDDAALLIEDTTRTIEQVKQAQISGEAFGSLKFAFCPSCLQPLEQPSDHHHCHLCRSELNPEQERSRYARMRNELEVQLKESLALQEHRLDRRSDLTDNLDKLQRARKAVADELLALSRHYTTEADAKIDELTRRVGFLDRDLLELDRERRLANEVLELSSEKARLNGQLGELKANIQSWLEQKAMRQSAVYGLIQRLTSDILLEDLESDIERVFPEGVVFDFNANTILINGKRGYSASSLTVIKNAFHLAMLFASCAEGIMKYPRFLLLDNIEDKGMTPERSQNFQRIIKKFSDTFEVEHQIIFTTSMPSADLETPDVTVGEKYTEIKKSLRI